MRPGFDILRGEDGYGLVELGIFLVLLAVAAAIALAVVPH